MLDFDHFFLSKKVYLKRVELAKKELTEVNADLFTYQPLHKKCW
jgi:hypothetical protein